MPTIRQYERQDWYQDTIDKAVSEECNAYGDEDKPLRRAVLEEVRCSGGVMRGGVRCLPGLSFGQETSD